MVPHCSVFLIPALHCCSAFLLNPALCLPCGSHWAIDQCVDSTHQNFSSVYRSILLTCSPAGRSLSVVVRLLWFSEEFRRLLSPFSINRDVGATLLIVRWIFPWILRGVFISWFINAGVSTVFTVFRSVWLRGAWFCYPYSVTIARSSFGNFCQFLFQVAELLPDSEVSGGFLCERSSLFSDSHDNPIWLALLLLHFW